MVNSMLSIGIRNEIKKFFSLKVFIFTIFILGVIPIVISILGLFTSRVLGIRVNDAVFSTHNIMMNYIMPFCIIIISNRVFTSEIRKGYIVNILSKPISKLELYFSKIVTISIFCILIILVNVAISAVINMITEGIEVSSVLKGAVAMAVSIMPIIMTVFLASAVSQITDSGFKNFLIFYFILFVAFLTGTAFPVLYPMTAGSIFSYFTLFIGSSLDIRNIIVNGIIIAGYIFLFAGLGGYMFEKRIY